MKRQTQAIHTKYARRDAYDALSMPVYNAVAFEFDDAKVMADAFTNRIDAPDYSRVENPTVTYLEQKVKTLTGAANVTALNSGMAAISNTLMALSGAGKNIVTSRHLFGNTLGLLTNTLGRFGVEARLCDLTNLDEVSNNIDENTCCIFLEIMTNPQLEVADLSMLAQTAHSKGLPLVATVSSHATMLAAEEARYYERKGAAAINIMPPSFAGPTQGMIADHIIEIARAVDIPLIIQYAPALTGQVILADTFSRIGNAGRELYIKLEASPTGPAITALRQQTRDQYGIIVGNGGECMFEALERGACAVMPGAATIPIFRKIYDAYASGDTLKAFTLFNRFLPHIHFMLRDIESFVALEKIILHHRGVIGNSICRRPCKEIDAYTRQLLDRHLAYLRELG